MVKKKAPKEATANPLEEIEAKDNHITELEDQLQKTKDQLEGVKGQRTQWEQDAKKAQEDLYQAATRVEELERFLKEANEQVELYKKLPADLQEQLEEVKRDRDAFERNCRELREELNASNDLLRIEGKYVLSGIFRNPGDFESVDFEKPAIPQDEPVFILRARDMFALQTIVAYRKACYDGGCHAGHINAIDERFQQFDNYAKTHSLKKPD